MATETIVAVFRTAADADRAASALEAAGVPSHAIDRHHGSTYGQSGADATLAHPATTDLDNERAPGERSGGFWGWLTGASDDSEDHRLYDQAMAGGGVVLSVIVPETEASHIATLLEQHNPVEVEQGDPMTEGTVGAASGMAGTRPLGGTASDDVAPASIPAATRPTGTAAATGTGAATGARATGEKADDQEVIRLAEERLDVGKREVASGTTRIRRYVVERPVEEQIRLRTESVRVDRRPVTGDTRVADDAFTDKVVEVREMSEEAIASKSARVVEEVVVGKTVTDRVETVRDTVRREEVEVDKVGSTDARAAGAQMNDPARPGAAHPGTNPAGTNPTGTTKP